MPRCTRFSHALAPRRHYPLPLMPLLDTQNVADGLAIDHDFLARLGGAG